MAKVILVPRINAGVFGGVNLPVNEFWPTGLQPTMSLGGMTLPLPQSQKTVAMPVMSISYDAWLEQAPWYGIKADLNYQGYDIDNRMWDRQTFRRRLEECDCEIVLVQPNGDSYRVGWSETEACHQFNNWFSQEQKKHRFEVRLPQHTPVAQVEQWLKDNVNGPYRYSQLGGFGNNGAIVTIKDDDEAFHFEMRWRLPKEEPA